MFVTDGLRGFICADFAFKPCARVFAASFTRQGDTPFSKLLFQIGIVELRQIADFANTKRVQLLLRDFSHSGDLAHIKRRKKFRLATGDHIQDPIRLGFAGANFRDQP